MGKRKRSGQQQGTIRQCNIALNVSVQLWASYAVSVSCLSLSCMLTLHLLLQNTYQGVTSQEVRWRGGQVPCLQRLPEPEVFWDQFVCKRSPVRAKISF